MFRKKKRKKKKKKRNTCSAPVTRRVCCVSDKSRSGNSRKLPNAPASEFTSTTTATLTRTRATMWQHVSRRYTSARRLAAARTICATLERYTYTHTVYVPTKMRIHFLQNVSHSAAHYRRNEKGMMRGGKLGRRKTFGLVRRRGREREETVRERRRRREEGRERKRGAQEDAKGQGGGRNGERRERGRTGGGGGKGEPEHFVKQGKMRLRRGTTAAFLSLQNYVFRGPPPYLSKHNKFPLCVSRFSSAPALSSTGVSSFASFSFPPRFTGRTRLCPSSTRPNPAI